MAYIPEESLEARSPFGRGFIGRKQQRNIIQNVVAVAEKKALETGQPIVNPAILSYQTEVKKEEKKEKALQIASARREIMHPTAYVESPHTLVYHMVLELLKNQRGLIMEALKPENGAHPRGTGLIKVYTGQMQHVFEYNGAFYSFNAITWQRFFNEDLSSKADAETIATRLSVVVPISEAQYIKHWSYIAIDHEKRFQKTIDGKTIYFYEKGYILSSSELQLLEQVRPEFLEILGQIATLDFPYAPIFRFQPVEIQPISIDVKRYGLQTKTGRIAPEIFNQEYLAPLQKIAKILGKPIQISPQGISESIGSFKGVEDADRAQILQARDQFKEMMQAYISPDGEITTKEGINIEMLIEGLMTNISISITKGETILTYESLKPEYKEYIKTPEEYQTLVIQVRDIMADKGLISPVETQAIISEAIKFNPKDYQVAGMGWTTIKRIAPVALTLLVVGLYIGRKKGYL